MPLGRPWHRSRRQVEQWSVQLHPHACQRQSPLQPPFTPSSHPCGAGVQVVRSPHPRRSDVLRCQPAVWRPLSPPQLGRRSPSPRPPPCPRQPRRASQSPASPVAEGLDLYLPYLKHIWRLASIKTVCAWTLPSKTALYQWTFMRPKKKKKRSWEHITWKHGQKLALLNIGNLPAISWISLTNVGHAGCYIGNVLEEDLWDVQQWIRRPNLNNVLEWSTGVIGRRWLQMLTGGWWRRTVSEWLRPACQNWQPF